MFPLFCFRREPCLLCFSSNRRCFLFVEAVSFVVSIFVEGFSCVGETVCFAFVGKGCRCFQSCLVLLVKARVLPSVFLCGDLSLFACEAAVRASVTICGDVLFWNLSMQF